MSCNPTSAVSARRRAKRLDLYIEQGADFEIPIVYKEDDVAVDLTGCTVRSQFRERINSADPLIDLSTPDEGLVLDGPAGKITMTISAAQTASLKIYKGVWDMLIIFPDGSLFRILQGAFEISRGVTR